MIPVHYFELYLFAGIAAIVAIYLAAYLMLLLLEDRRLWRRFQRKEPR